MHIGGKTRFAAAFKGAAATLVMTLGPGAATASGEAGAPEEGVGITLPAGNGMIVLAVRSGPLPRGAELILETPQGQVLGSVSPFGRIVEQTPERVDLIVVPRHGMPQGQITVLARVRLGERTRPATPEEFLGVQIVSQP